MVGCNMHVGQFSMWHIEDVHVMYNINIKHTNIFATALFSVKCIP